MLGDTPVTVYWTMLYNSCILLSSSFCDSSHIVTKRSILFRVSTKATASVKDFAEESFICGTLLSKILTGCPGLRSIHFSNLSFFLSLMSVIGCS